ncbi:hypothetical protein AKJ53_01210 [candidate division MSBL1 archaeon SCGC-AAA382F02]|uniref:Polymerase beta nucleotidyltransferase domain-containing protein n=1 Tax=candidate division MSBL1 archaeon SCGC-AAA382F02 TaxID=1698282 RepID=A0A133VI79_9EURY|nr:hypothetical protein AKJ53_01210 [candidate division MSBL1 archaeon SCGC-AAA382F02]
MKIKKSVEKTLQSHKEVLAAYLYGSIAKGTTHKESDVDIALLLEEGFSPEGLYTARISEEIEKKMNANREVDVRVLNDRPITFQHQVLRDGKKIFTRDRRARINFETEVYDRYLDYRPFFDRFNEIRRKRILA